MLGKFPNNNKHIEVQLMRRFDIEMQLYSLSLPETFQEKFADLLKGVTRDVFRHVEDNQSTIEANFSLYHLSNSNLQEADVSLLFRNAKLPSRWMALLLTNCELIALSRVLRGVFSEPGFIPEIGNLPKSLKCYKRIEFGSEVFSKFNDSRYGRHSSVLANWAGDEGDIDTNYGLRPGRIKQILIYKFCAGDGVIRSLAVARVEWYKAHPNKLMFGVGIELWNRNEFEPFGPSSYIPIPCINSKFAPAYGSILVTHPDNSDTHESVLFPCPLRCKTFM